MLNYLSCKLSRSFSLSHNTVTFVSFCLIFERLLMHSCACVCLSSHSMRMRVAFSEVLTGYHDNTSLCGFGTITYLYFLPVELILIRFVLGYMTVWKTGLIHCVNQSWLYTAPFIMTKVNAVSLHTHSMLFQHNMWGVLAALDFYE